MKSLIKQIHEQWRHAKQQAEIDCVRCSLPDVAQKYRVCNMFKGDEDIEGVLRLFLSTQGMEFILKRHFPTLATMRLFKEHDALLRKHGIYLDAGEVSLTNPERAVLIGRTVGTIHIDRCERHQVILLRGAKATVVASGWGWVKTEAETGCALTRHVSDNAMIL